MLIGLSRSLVLLEFLMSEALRTAVCGQGAVLPEQVVKADSKGPCSGAAAPMRLWCPPNIRGAGTPCLSGFVSEQLFSTMPVH